MAPLGPPPYTSEQIMAMTSPEEQTRARAELKSYIVRLKKEKEEREALQSHASGPGFAGARGGYSAYRAAPRRGGYAFGGGRGYYHPYQRPQTQQKFWNKTATFIKSEPGIANDTSRPATNNNFPAPSDQQETEPKTLCPALTSTGVCSRRGCRYLHDPNKQALCKRWLYKGECPKGEYCPLSHAATPHNAPTCQHFQDGHCKNDDCRFAHIRLNPAALNCEDFGRMGYCEKGDSCSELHAYECPTFANTGACQYGDRCRLGHVHRASRMRQATRLSSPVHSPSENTPNASDTPEDDMDTAEDAHEWILPKKGSPKTQQFTEQADFVRLDAEE